MNATLVRGAYEWWGIARICYELFDRTGFWCIALGIWAAGVAKESDPSIWHRLFVGRFLWAWGTMAAILLCLSGLHVLNPPTGSFVDFLALCIILSGVPALELARHSSISLGMLSILRSTAAGSAVFAAYTCIAYFHTMIKGSLFILAVPNDILLWNADALLLGKSYYQLLAHWRSSHGSIVQFLDIAYIGLLQQVCWSALFFHGARDWVNGRRYLAAMFLIYSIGPAIYFVVPSKGPIFYAPDLFRDLRMLAPDTWHLARFLTWSTDSTVAGILHEISPFAYIAALPSLHVGIALIMFAAMRQSATVSLFNAVLLALTVAATNILGWHYAVDLLAGLMLGALSWAFACRISPLQDETVAKPE
ncbi:MAG TPA: phosphatase PAP2 family protein [Accumulibacter sp.]|uniref:phosphatase PAP2 family protein n=1 Tax=Accumulibacter sp. TaxID=2053492 RepID=UPI0025D8C649|nr:phosphatase PAP2 family protein [Accumulibacter sp.]MCM8600144.1 phosphatase PAP2 family protein [Accumulibacter sp.]MCM8662747.1 phosphatase PAP2 family protein [Accumulibacter sp.]HNC53243.1 phosphatase PAP2 family protein [Accumulibacter sp.]